VYHHAYLGIERSGLHVPKSVGDANMVFYSFRMPLFFIISGMFTSMALASRSVKSLVWSKFNVLLYPYLVWSFLQITLQIVMSGYTNADRTFSDYLYILYQPKRLDQFWYLPALFNATIVFVLLKTKLKFRTGHQLAVALIFYALAPFINEISMMSNWMRFYIFVAIGDLLSGFIFKASVQHQLRKAITFFLCLPVFAVTQFFYFYNNIGLKSSETDLNTFQGDLSQYVFNEVNFLVTSLIGCGTFIVVAFLLEKWNRVKWLRVVGFHSLFIYIMHVMIVAFLRIVMTKVFGVDNYMFVLLAAIAVGTALPIVFYNVFGKKHLWFLFTTKRPVKVPAGYKPLGGFTEPIAEPLQPSQAKPQ
jgi:fucose 4-O-acetylase-like acetyltransferase